MGIITYFTIKFNTTITIKNQEGGGEPTLEEMMERLAAMGVDKSKLESIKAQVQVKSKIKESKQKRQVDDDERRNRQVEEQKEQAQGQGQNQRNVSQESQESLDTLDGDGENDDA